MAFVDDLFLPIEARPSFLSLFWAYLAGFITLLFRGAGVGFEDPHLRLML